jgi:hypothetical protein
MMSTESPKPPKQYKSPGSFKSAFDSKYRDKPGHALVVVMQRFSARVCKAIEGAVVKGGLGLEMRLDTPRTTKDADIIISAAYDLDRRLADAGGLDLGDYLRFSVTPERRGSKINAPGMLYPGVRYKVQARFTSGPGPWSSPPDRTFTAEISVRSPAGFDVFESRIEGFPLVPVAAVRVYSLSWQIAEKVHAYTDSRHTESQNPDLMRPRDLLDICRCSTARRVEAKITSVSLRAALEQTFERRKLVAQEHQVVLQDLPQQLPRMPESWETAFQREVQRSSLPWRNSLDAYKAAAQFLDPILEGSADGEWVPEQRRWVSAAGQVASSSEPPDVGRTEPKG